MSINTFAFSTFAAALGLANGVITPALAVLLLAFFSMQLAEAAAWVALEGPGEGAGGTRAPAVAAALLLVLQPIVVLGLVLVDGPNAWAARLVPGGASTVAAGMWALAAVYAAAMAVKVAKYGRALVLGGGGGGGGSDMFRMERAANGHLRWPFVEDASPFCLGAYFVTMLAGITLACPLWLSAVTWFTLAASVVTYWKQRTWGTMWCWTANVVALVIVWMVVRVSGCSGGRP